MKLSPREQEGLLVYQAGSVAQRRLARGVRLNHPETVALIALQLQELARDGLSVSELMDLGRRMLGRNQIMPGVGDMLNEIQVEATFPDGTKLVTVHAPICADDGDMDLAFYGSFLPIPDLNVFSPDSKVFLIIPGEIMPQKGEITINKGRQLKSLRVTSVCDRPIQVGSHYHFIEVNKYLTFDRRQSYGMRLNIPAGTAVRFEPGDTKTVCLTSIAGNRIIRGGNSLCDGPVKEERVVPIMNKIAQKEFGHKDQVLDWFSEVLATKPATISRTIYAHTYGPTTGDKVRLGDTSLIIEVEKDHTVYGEELTFGGGKVLREGMGQAANRPCLEVLDTVISNALIVDAVTGIIKADVGIKNGKIVGIGKSGNPDIMDGVDKNLIVGAGTEAIAGEGLILTAGGIDAHVHFICPQLIREAIASGLTTLLGGGTGPATGTNATTCTPGPNHIKQMLQSTDAFPMNFGFTGKGNTSAPDQAVDLRDQILAGAVGLKLHEDWGSTPSAIDTALRTAEEYDVQVMLHTDTLNESSCVEQTIESLQGRTIHAYHSEGAGGGHAPDIIKVCGVMNVLPSSTNPTRPYTSNTIDEHLDMLMVCHHLNKNLKEDVAFAESRIRAETIAAEDILHDMGAISMMASDSQAMGRIGEVITRNWQTADKMKLFRGQLPEETGENDNERVKRYVAKYTINPALAHGFSHIVGSVEVGKLADLVLWNPAFFGAKPNMIIKGGQIAWAQMGMPNASIPTPEPVKQRKMFGAYGKSVGAHSVVFVSKASLETGYVHDYGLSKSIVAVKSCRTVNKTSMIRNNYCPNIEVNPQTYKVQLLHDEDDGSVKPEVLECPASSRLSLAQRYFLF
ncbi:hypothetical protein LOTGIDRAFT_105464 [Lottia gigantea]|uniref:Urease n=1 Tax=Lottia gigantea TaxID=225164 RepID=V4BRA5_LOTGI|nr:hypothetical protein LOTGIDRAFT_105464 [Lottia gigantea]ESO91379.1 hypothetical protein LOTGIDRAFT_105464 [Lottia gigantea]